jgi:exodeoxyribonuclease V alpha subunit
MSLEISESRVKGKVTRIEFAGPAKFGGTFYCVLRLEDGTKARGPTDFTPRPGMTLVLEGFWDGFDFKFSDADRLIDLEETSFRDILLEVPGVGPTAVKKLITRLGQGKEALDQLFSDPEVLRKVIRSKRVASKAIKHVQTLDPDREKVRVELLDMFRAAGINRAPSAVRRLIREFGRKAPSIVRKNPYLLCDLVQVGFGTADKFAISLGISPSDPERHKAALVETLRGIESDGHTWATQDTAISGATNLLGVPLAGGISRLAALDTAQVRLFDHAGPGAGAARLKTYQSEADVARLLRQLLASAQPLEFDPLEHAAAAGLAEEQRDAVRRFVTTGFALLTGLPGTGKTYLVAALVAALEAEELGVAVVAPTGKAANALNGKLAGVCRTRATTIHRALEPIPPKDLDSADKKRQRVGDFVFCRGASDPLDCAVLIVDETSMVDITLLAALLAALKPGTRVMFVGDPDQLPSVQPGAVLRDLIDSDALPVASLREIRRADAAATSVKLCHAIHAAQVIPPDREIDLPGANWVHVPARGPDGVLEVIEAIYSGRLLPILTERFSRSDDFLTLVPYRTGKTISADTLNVQLRRIINPAGVEWTKRYPGTAGPGEIAFGPDDRVMCTRNRWLGRFRFDGTWVPADDRDILVANGDSGRVRAVDEKARRFIVAFDLIGIVGVPFKNHSLEHAYATTIHKAQGSGIKVAIVPVLDEFSRTRPGRPAFWSRELFYTAVSRTTDVLVTVGETEGIRKAIANPCWNHRRTLLAHFLRSDTRP